ncbi:SET domain-containing protein SmydA-8-like [Bacillus rossius redtenbacheri]|uniref:SET domain-containing protein SmydA-8-like n=1 Tax=Bacillus rossius redtenbacheri TaxID=93214 RepID=UPI002FDDCFB1
MQDDKQPPCSVEESDVLGRYLVASRDVAAGELLLREAPLAVGPRADAAPVCLACYRPLPLRGDRLRCSRCGVVPLCDARCERGGGHTEAECSALAARGAPRGLLDCSQLVLPLRCLLLRQAPPPDAWRWDALLGMEAHLGRRRGTAVWRSHQAVVDKALQAAGFAGPDDGELVQRLCGVLDVNCFEVRSPGAAPQEALRLRAVYPRAALMAHDCVANTHLAVDDRFTLAVHASVAVPRGAPLFFNYAATLQGTAERREHLREGKYFECRCARCRDPSELGTHLSSLLCHRCPHGEEAGMVTAVDPLERDGDWRCGRCGADYRPGLVRTAVARAVDLVEDVDRGSARDMEALLARLSRSLAPHHHALLELKQSLVAAYRDDPSPGRRALARKVELCRDLLPVVKALEPGISRLAGITLYELQGPLARLATKQFQGGDVDSDGLLATLREAEALLREALGHLVYEPHASPEGALARAAMSELRALRASAQEVEHAQEHAAALAAVGGRSRPRRRCRDK